MRKSISAFVIFFLLQGIAVAQDAISYQAIARNAAGQVVASQPIAVKFELRQGNISGTSVFTETHNTTTNQFGLFTLAIGSVSTTQFQAINWANGPFFLEVLLDPSGGTSFTSLGNQQLLSVPYALYAKTSGNTASTPTISINAPNTVTSSAGSYSINIPAATSYSAGTGISISGGIISNTATAVTPTITGLGSTTVTTTGNTFTVSTPVPQTYSAGTGISISGGVITNTAVASTATISGQGVSSVTASGNTFTVNTPAAALTYTAGSNQLSVTQGTAVSTITFTAGNVNGTGTAGVVPMWGGATTLTNSPINASTTTGGVIIAPSLAGSGSPAQSLQVQGPSSGSTYAAHFLQGTNPNTGIGISTQASGGHAIGTLNNQDLGFFANNTNVTGSYPLILKTSGRVGIGNVSPSYSLDVNGGINTSLFYNLNGLAAAPLTSNSGEGKLYFNSALNKLMMSENGGAWVPVANTLWTRGTGILYNTTLSDNVGIGTNIPGNTLDVLSTANVSALRAKNTGTGNGMEGGANSASSAGILGYNDGAGPGIAGSKSISVASGNAGRFEIFNTANASNALVAATPGNGAAVQAINTSTNALASNLSVLLEDGHLKARFTNAIPNSSVSIGGNNTLGVISVSTTNNADQSNDVRGAVTMSGIFLVLSNSAETADITLSFKKSYRNPPVVVLTPFIPVTNPDNVIITAQLVNVGVTDFTYRISVGNYGNTSVNFSSLTVNYFVIE